jgi:hypothetical protein
MDTADYFVLTSLDYICVLNVGHIHISFKLLACCHSGMRRTEGRGSCTAARGGCGSCIESDHGGLEQSTVSDVALGLPRYFVNGSTGCTALDLCGVPWGLIVLRFCDGRKVTFTVEEVNELQLIVVHVRLVVGGTCRGQDSFICRGSSFSFDALGLPIIVPTVFWEQYCIPVCKNGRCRNEGRQKVALRDDAAELADDGGGGLLAEDGCRGSLLAADNRSW